MASIRDVMTPEPVVIPADASMADAARAMRDHAIGDVLISDGGNAFGIVTDRDLVVRGLAEGRTDASVGELATTEVLAVRADAEPSDAVQLMRERAIRRLPVVEDNRVVGMVSLGDLAQERDRDSALADISAAPPNS